MSRFLDSPRVATCFALLASALALAPVAVRKARTVIAEVNPNMPHTMGESTIPLDAIDHRGVNRHAHRLIVALFVGQ